MRLSRDRDGMKKCQVPGCISLVLGRGVLNITGEGPCDVSSCGVVRGCGWRVYGGGDGA